MATVNHKKTIRAAEVTAFGGIDASSPCGDGGVAVDLKNFKVLPDGSLCRRSGFSVLRSFDGAVRGAAVFRDADGTFLLAAVGTSVYRVSAADGSAESAEVLFTAEGEVSFFSYDGEIYLVDGAELYRYLGGASFEVCRGYVPLYGKDWNAELKTNPINEPINLASDKIRFHYVAGTMFGTLYFGVKLASVDRVVEGDVERTYARTLSADGTSMTFTSPFRSTKPITVYATVDPSYYHDAILRACRGAARYEAFQGSRVMLYGGGDSARLFVSRPVDAASLAAAQAEHPNATGLYFPKGGAMTLESREAITAVDRVGERMMICTADNAWITEELRALAAETTVLPLRSLSRTVGCVSTGGLAVTGGDAPVTVSASGVYRWRIDPQLDVSASVTRISDAVAPLLPDGALARARLGYVCGEDTLWLYDPEDGEGRVFLYDCAASRWYSYVGVGARRLLEADGRVGFLSGNAVSFFDGARSTDLCVFGEREIVATYESRRADFGDAEATKRAVRVFVEAELGGALAVGLIDGTLLDEAVLHGKGDGARCYEAKVASRRFRRLSVTLRATGKSPCRILGLCVHAAT